MGTRSSGVFDAYKLRLASESKSRLQSRYRGFRSLLSGKTVAATCSRHGGKERRGRGGGRVIEKKRSSRARRVA